MDSSSKSSNKTFTVNLSSSSKPPSAPVKDWESSFAKLASSYGFGAAVPSLPDKKTTDVFGSSSKKKNVTVPSQSSPPRPWFPKPQFKSKSALVPPESENPKIESAETTGSKKNYEEAYAKLSSCYGFGGLSGSNHAGKK